VDAASAAQEYGAGERSASSTRVVLTGAEKTLRIATQQYAGYTEIVHSVGAVRDDVNAGVRTPSPPDLDYLNAVCGSSPGTRV
jgi:hypothetical protein